jgi:DNA-binding MarR family transcriptional regulator
VTKPRPAPTSKRAPHPAPDPEAAARELGALFPAVYLRFHRRDGKRRELPAASRSALQHLTLTGPLSIGELSKHFERAQSVVSELIEHLERDGYVERMRDAQDKRRSLIWLSERGLQLLEREREVLSSQLVLRAMQRMRPSARRALLDGMRALLDADAAAALGRDVADASHLVPQSRSRAPHDPKPRAPRRPRKRKS